MTTVDTVAAPPRLSTWRVIAPAVAALVVIGVAVRVADVRSLPAVHTFLLVFGSLLIEALPFIALGAVVSAIVEVFVPASVFARLGRLPRGAQLPVAGLGGFAFPVCECGSVPVARRLALKGLSPAAAVTFMLAAPVLNPVVLVSTAVAYRGRGALVMVLARAVLALVAAVAVGWVVGPRGRRLVRDRHDDRDVHPGSRWRAFVAHLASDFVLLGRYLVIGAAIASLLQTMIPQQVIGAVAEAPVLSVLAMMALAGVLSLCSESDAFVAASFVQFGAASQLAFLVFGPMVDAKLAVLYGRTFTRGFVTTVILVVAAVTLAGALWLEIVIG